MGSFAPFVLRSTQLLHCSIPCSLDITRVGSLVVTHRTAAVQVMLDIPVTPTSMNYHLVYLAAMPLRTEETHLYLKYVFPTLVNVCVPSTCLLSTHDQVRYSLKKTYDVLI